ncbi:substrate-binding periplasmic protein [Catenuloplanes sp. NPDC051500]|uniref:substrate-binding periplasmic protein n=1 Tax=Catenuloplanes sp. NPDC051500 TaxID=3363959 RepID=UPI0037A69FBD
MRRELAGLTASLLLVTGTAGCQWPRDPGGTLEHVRNGVLRVGVTANPPWTVVQDGAEPAGVEPELVRRLAEQLGARVEWSSGTESTLMPAVRDRTLDLVIGGLNATAPWTAEASLSTPYITTRTVVAAPPGVAVPEELDGVRVAVRGGTPDVAALDGTGAEVVTVAEVTGTTGMPAAVGEWELAALGLAESDHEIATEAHVWATPPGENGWQVEVEGFLLDQSDAEVLELLKEAGR